VKDNRVSRPRLGFFSVLSGVQDMSTVSDLSRNDSLLLPTHVPSGPSPFDMVCRRCAEQNRHGRMDGKRFDIPFVPRADRTRRFELIADEAFDRGNCLEDRV
jgi:hypothetical protein